MQCPFCNIHDTKVVDSRLHRGGEQIRRRRECLACNERFTTFETIELDLPRIIKRDGSRCKFNQDKIRQGMMKALEKRPISTATLDSAIHRMIHKIRTLGEQEIESQHLGELAMDELREIDAVAYVRFASIYRSFQDIDAFNKEIEKLKEHTDND